LPRELQRVLIPLVLSIKLESSTATHLENWLARVQAGKYGGLKNMVVFAVLSAQVQLYN
jgi:hypothetical protein